MYRMELSDYKKLISSFTSSPSQEKTVWKEDGKLCMLFIEFRNMDIIKHNLNNICNVYGGTDASLSIVHSGENEEMILDITKDWKNVKYMKLYENNIDIHEYNHLLTSHEFWSRFSKHEYVLLNQWDSYLFKEIPNKFFSYDLVGGPIAHFYVIHNGTLMNICSEECKCPRCNHSDHPFKAKNFKDHPNKMFLYNGGFCLHKVSSTIELCKSKQWTGEPEDVYFSISNLTKPSLEEAAEFSVNHTRHHNPAGCHQVWIHDEDYVRSLFK